MSKPLLHLDADTSIKALETKLVNLGHNVTRTPTDWMPLDASDEQHKSILNYLRTPQRHNWVKLSSTTSRNYAKK